MSKGKVLLICIFAVMANIVVQLGFDTNPKTPATSTPAITEKQAGSGSVNVPSINKVPEQRVSLERFQAATKTNTTVVSSSITSYGELVIEVPQAWHFQPKAIRLQLAQDLQKIWKRCDSAGSADFTLIDFQGNEIGGRGFTGVWVSD